MKSAGFLLLAFGFVIAVCGPALAGGGTKVPPAPAASDDDASIEALVARAYSTERLRSRRKRLRAILPERSILLVSAGFQQHLSRFRVRSSYRYLTGLTEPGGVLVLGPGEAEVLYLRRRSGRRAAFDGMSLSAASPAVLRAGLGEVRPLADLRPALGKRLSDLGNIYHEGVARLDAARIGIEDYLYERGRDGPVVESGVGFIGALRRVKDEAEIALMRRSARLTCLALREAIRSAGPGVGERDVDATFLFVGRRLGAERQAFAPIVASGKRGCTLHYFWNRERMAGGELLLMDVGLEVGGYASDVTRTVPVSGRFTPEQAHLARIVLKAQHAGFAHCRVGNRISQVHAAAYRVIAKAGYGAAFPHYTCHYIGMDAHDVGDFDEPLVPGVVITVEPGIYLREKGIGIRFEDDVLITKHGPVVLSSSLTRDLDALAALVRERGIGEVPLEAAGAAAGAGSDR